MAFVVRCVSDASQCIPYASEVQVWRELASTLRDARNVIEFLCFDGAMMEAFFERLAKTLGREFCIATGHTESLFELSHQRASLR